MWRKEDNLIIEVATGKKFQRSGYCQRCGKCCKGKYLFKSLLEDPNYSQEDKDVLREASKVFKIDFSKQTCPHLQILNGVAKCNNYKTRPPFCVAFPEVPTDIMEGCGFKFKEV